MLSLEVDFYFHFFFNRTENLPPLEFVVWFLRNLEYCIHILHPPTERMYLKMKIFQAIIIWKENIENWRNFHYFGRWRSFILHERFKKTQGFEKVEQSVLLKSSINWSSCRWTALSNLVQVQWRQAILRGLVFCVGRWNPARARVWAAPRTGNWEISEDADGPRQVARGMLTGRDRLC